MSDNGPVETPSPPGEIALPDTPSPPGEKPPTEEKEK